MKFEWKQATSPLDGELVYSRGDYAIDFEVASKERLSERCGNNGSTSFVFTTLQIEVGIDSRELLYPWGYFARVRWKSGRLTLPLFRSGRLKVEGVELLLGVSVGVPESDEWPIIWDPDSGWLCFGTPLWPDSIAIEYAKGAGVSIAQDQIVAIWLKPKFVD